MFIVDGNVPLRDGHFIAHWDRDGVREHQVGDAVVHRVAVDTSRRDEPESVVGILRPDHWPVKFAKDPGQGNVGAGRAAAKLFAVGLLGILVFEKNDAGTKHGPGRYRLPAPAASCIPTDP